MQEAQVQRGDTRTQGLPDGGEKKERWRWGMNKERKLTKNEQCVLDYLRGKEWVSPTKIGITLHPTRMHGSPWASPICLRLTNKGLLERNDKGWYRNPQR
ncbi:hypothetical protein LCGC14_1649600 [marine sediment metagenome]|uniref:LexA repressor DNA-binding domain-containing protein n=1 Tax=marine sediment metagenome TaxID=412755 RepID=A0A0F9KD40_9ZZZZ